MNMGADFNPSQTNLKGRSFVKLLDFTPGEIQSLLALSKSLKDAQKAGTEKKTLEGKTIALIFEKDSTRTRCAFEVAALHQGANTVYLGPEGNHIGSKETIADSARVLGGMFDAIQYRGHGQKIVETLAEYAGVPVYNGLTDEFHPTQILADFLTMWECCPKPLQQQTLVYLGDGANNMANSLMIGAAMLGINFRMASPETMRPPAELVAKCAKMAESNDSELAFFADAKEAVKGADFLYTDVWLSMGQSEADWDKKVQALLPYRVDSTLLEETGNSSCKFLHCLPAFHDRETPTGAKFFDEFGLEGIEVSHHVFESEASVVFQQSENRLHTIKAIMVATL